MHYILFSKTRNVTNLSEIIWWTSAILHYPIQFAMQKQSSLHLLVFRHCSSHSLSQGKPKNSVNSASGYFSCTIKDTRISPQPIFHLFSFYLLTLYSILQLKKSTQIFLEHKNRLFLMLHISLRYIVVLYIVYIV